MRSLALSLSILPLLQSAAVAGPTPAEVEAAYRKGGMTGVVVLVQSCYKTMGKSMDAVVRCTRFDAHGYALDRAGAATLGFPGTPYFGRSITRQRITSAIRKVSKSETDVDRGLEALAYSVGGYSAELR